MCSVWGFWVPGVSLELKFPRGFLSFLAGIYLKVEESTEGRFRLKHFSHFIRIVFLRILMEDSNFVDTAFHMFENHISKIMRTIF